MKRLFVIITLLLLVSVAFGQAKKRDKVKRKYRKIEKVAVQKIPVYFRGKVRDADKNLLQGVHVQIKGLKKSVHTNDDGEFFFYNLPEGKIRIHFTLMGFKTKFIDYVLKQEQNYHNVTLDEDKAHYLPEIATAQKRQQHILDIPTSVKVINSEIVENSNATSLSAISNFISGFRFTENGSIQPNFVFRGVGNTTWQPGVQPRISTLINNVPVSPDFLPFETFDIEKIEVLKGVQQTKSGNNAEIGSIHYQSQKPGEQLQGYISAGGGNFNQQEFRGAINYPILEDKLFARFATVYKNRDGYIENTLGEKLNGQNTLGGRLSVRYLPAYNMKLDLVVNYQKEKSPGVGFINTEYPDISGDVDIFTFQSTIGNADKLGVEKDIFDATLKYRYAHNEHFFWTSVSSYRKNNGFNNWDADGVAANALNFSDNKIGSQLSQEIRFNFSSNSKLNGFIGANYKAENSEQKLTFSTDEQQLFSLFFPELQPFNASESDELATDVPPLPDFSPVSGMQLSSDLSEQRITTFRNRGTEAFLNVDYQFSNRLVLLGGIRAGYNWMKLGNENILEEETESTLGNITGNSPGLFFHPDSLISAKDKELNINWNAGFQYFFTDNINIFGTYSRAKRPSLMHYNLARQLQKPKQEKLSNYETGIKLSLLRKVFISATGFYQQYKNLQNPVLIANSTSNSYTYNIEDFGNANTYGAEASLKASPLKGLHIFGNYTWLHAQFEGEKTDSLNVGIEGNKFPLAPEHSFSAGFSASVMATPTVRLFVTPQYAYQTDFYFDRANSENLKQPAYGILNINGGVEFTEPNVILNIYATNMLEENYISSVGNDGSLFGLTTVVPGAPRMFGARLTWKF